jgi:uncharacterized protein (DUF924 family)
MSDSVLKFWFDELSPKQWWAVDVDLDAAITERFTPLLEQTIAGELCEWRKTALGRLAEIIVLDQFSRNIYRNTPGAFAQDPLALALSQEAVSQGCLADLNETERAFMLMPYMHSESALIHQQAEPLFAKHAPANLDFEIRHKAIIDRFGRYPHRNKILDRESTPEEIEFLKQPGSSF